MGPGGVLTPVHSAIMSGRNPNSVTTTVVGPGSVTNSQTTIFDCYKSPFSSQQDILSRLDLFISLEQETPEVSTATTSNECKDFTKEVEKLNIISDKLCKKMDETRA